LLDEAIAAKEMQEEFSETWSSDTAAEIAATLPFADQHELTRLAFLFAVSRNPRHSREIFRILKAAQERGRRQ
jgi:ribosome-associated protein